MPPLVVERLALILGICHTVNHQLIVILLLTRLCNLLLKVDAVETESIIERGSEAGAARLTSKLAGSGC